MNNPKNHKLKQKTKTNNPKNQKKPKSKLKMNKQKRQDPQRLKDIRIPVEPLIPECEVCERQKAHFYCTVCKVHYCQNCESQVHTSFLKKKHKEFTFQEPYDPQENNCPIHQNNKLSRYCKNCQKLICSECVFDHTNHATIAFDQPMDFYKELINEQKKYTQNHFEKINEKFEQLNNSEKDMKSKKEKIFREISKFYLNQKKLLDLLEQNEIKLANDFFEQIKKSMNIEKQTINNLKYSTETLLKQFNKLESNIKQSNSFGFYKLFSQIELTKRYEKIQNELEEVINKINSINEKKEEFVQKIENEKFNSLKEKQINMKLVKKNYQKLNELTQYQFKKMNEEISIEQNEKYMKLNKQSMKMQKGIDEFNESEMIIKEIEICKKYNDYQQILLNFFKLKKLLPILNKNEKNKELICNSKFNKINIISNELKQNLKNWKLNLPFDLNKTQINLPDEIQLENKLKFSILLKDQFNEIVNAQEFNPKAEILKSNSNEMITKITKFKEGTNQELIGEYLFEEEGEYQINISINDQKIPKSPFKLKVIDHLFLEESEILQKENNPKFNQILEKWIKEAGCNLNLKRRFNSRTDGWKYQSFHQKCDNKGKSILLIKLKNKSLFGGFAAIDWDTTNRYKRSNRNKSFIFSLISLDPNFKEPLKMPIFHNDTKNNEIYCNRNMGPIFGGGHDLCLGFNDRNMNEYNGSYLGGTYKPPFGYKYGSIEAKNFLAGSGSDWDISQIEIFCEN
ncbi:hypothetical protein M0813_11579 [Anaeramoeba flamelloides]|uniref:B box-type domain-containing protein n=1 Tax=Anaeramoeba flamelloides TaxID=1746091 RepID=A0ABQ8ZEG1_9EUKA|nr:hypothetical protein M0813_11579 [Anaeramoeba flamelloides]